MSARYPSQPQARMPLGQMQYSRWSNAPGAGILNLKFKLKYWRHKSGVNSQGYFVHTA
jgi:hypothetical protein